MTVTAPTIVNTFLLNKQCVLKSSVCLFLIFTFIISASSKSNYQKAFEYFAINSDEFMVTDQYVSKKSGIEHIYFKQAFNGIEVNGTNSSIHFTKQNTVLVAHNRIIKNFKSKFKYSKVQVNTKQAIDIAAKNLGLQRTKNLKVVQKDNGKNKKAVYSAVELSSKNIPIKLVYYTLKDQSIVLAYKLRITEIDESHSWNVYINASTGKVIHKIDLMFSCGSDECNIRNYNQANNLEIENTSIKKNNKISSSNTSFIGGYNVYKLPLANPIDDGATRSIVINPQSAEASPAGWLNNSNTTFETVGNNIDAFNRLSRNRALSDTTGLFDFELNLKLNPINNIKASITNAFYLGNMAHDILYHHGFDEASGNFQNDNFNKGGQGGDALEIWVLNVNNCFPNYSPEPEGISPRIYPTFAKAPFFRINRDISFSNAVMLHEYAHGLSTRLVGGPSQVDQNALSVTNNLSEGWSDIIALILTIKSTDDGTTPQAVGNWLSNNPIGIRPFGGSCGGKPELTNVPYSTDLLINPYNYADVGQILTKPHEIGTVWANMLWEMTWALIEVYGFDKDLYNGEGGNNIALNLIIEAMKLSPVNPNFINGRDAILLADEAIYNGTNKCTIWKAFAKRKLGYGAKENVESTTPPNSCIFLSDSLINFIPQENLIENTFEASIYPNPFTSQTTIKVKIKNATTLSIFVTDILGKNITTIANQAKKQAGKHQFIFDGTNFPVGIYRCTFKASDHIITQKLVITK